MRAELSTAYHEAGHAVISYYLCVPFEYATIVPSVADGSLGHVEWPHPPKWAFDESSSRSLEQREFWENHVMIGFAGRLAQGKFLGRKVRYGYKRDYQNIADAALRFGGPSPEVHVHWCRWLHEKTKNMVERRWVEIERLAQTLGKQKTVTYDDAIEVISPGSRALRESLVKRKSLTKY